MEAQSIQCPGCGKTATGNFCSHCGTPVRTKCPACGAAVKPGSRACSQCGTALTSQPVARGWTAQTLAPWVAMGLAAVALVVSLWPASDRRSGAPEPELPPFTTNPNVSFSGPGQPMAGQPPDLSSMTPREAADRLFNRVMTASENGNKEEAARFAPMAISAYDRVGPLDNDARYHVALIYMTIGNIKSARAQLEQLRKAVPHHLLAYMLEHDLAERSGNKSEAARAYRDFLAAYDKEMMTTRIEYQEHRGGIDRFREVAQSSVAGKR